MRLRKAGLASVAFFYFDFRDSSKQDVRGALSSLLAQLSAQSDACCGVLESVYSAHDAGSKEPSEDALQECLKSMLTLQNQGPIFLVLDAIDECPNSAGTPSPRENVLRLLEWLSELRSSHLSICVTSRPEVDIEAVLLSLASRTVSLHGENGQKEDIVNYIKWFIDSDPKARKWRKEDKELVIKKLSKRANGMWVFESVFAGAFRFLLTPSYRFRWAFCQLDRLRRCLSPRIRRALDELPETLDETYERTLRDIDNENWEYAHRLFQCIVVACRPLRVEELAEFLAFKSEEGGNLTFEENWRPENPRDMVLSTCSSLITVVNVKGSPVIQFSHFSVKEYLTSNRIADSRMSRYYIPLEPAHIFVTEACLSFLIQLDKHVTRESIEEFPLAHYAGQYWTDHAEFGNASSHAEDMMILLFSPENHHLLNWVWIFDPISTRSMESEAPSRPKWAPLHYAAYYGFHRVAELLITSYSQDVNVSGVDSLTPLHIASNEGRFTVVQVLLKHQADVNAKTRYNWVPLHFVSYSTHHQLEVARLLIEHGAHVNLKDIFGQTPLLHLSMNNGNLEVAEMLLEHGADPNIRSTYDDGPLYAALRNGHSGPAQLLLKHGANPNTRDGSGQTPLHIACRRGDLKAAQGLLELRVDVSSRNNGGQTPLQTASRYGNEHLVQLLLQHGAEET